MSVFVCLATMTLLKFPCMVLVTVILVTASGALYVDPQELPPVHEVDDEIRIVKSSIQ